MKITIQFDTENAAFDNGNSRREIERIIKAVAARVKKGDDAGKVMDINGNSVGSFEVDQIG